MSQFAFGTGSLWGGQTQDAFGTVIANVTPIKFGEVQDVGIDISRDVKLLYGQLQFPVAIGGGKMKIDVKAKFARIMGKLFSDLMFGQTLGSGTLTGVVNDTTGSIIPASPFQIVPVPPSAGLYARDLGVVSALGLPLTRVASAPITGQYAAAGGTAIGATGSITTTVLTITAPPSSGSFQVGSTVNGTGVTPGTTIVSLGTGTGGNGTYNVTPSQTAAGPTFGAQPTYTFAAADAAAQVFISYTYTSVLASAKSMALTNQPMGYVPTFGMDLAIQFAGKQNNYRFPNCVASKLTIDPKQDDFTENSMDISIFADSAGNIGTLITQE